MAKPLWINKDAVSGQPVLDANEMRQVMALPLMYGGRNLGARQGVRPGGNQLEVSLAGSVITVQPGLCCIDPGLTTTQGPYWVAIPTAENPVGGPLAAADASNPRKDIVVGRVYDHDADNLGLKLARSEYIAGVAGPAPAEPQVPAGAFRLATIDVPRSGNGAPVVTNNFPYTVAAGGILPVRAVGDILAAVAGRYRDRLDTGVLERDNAAAWETIADPSIFKPSTPYVPVWSAAGTAPNLGNGTIAGSYFRLGKRVRSRGKVVFGSTTTFGSGTWRFSLPIAATTDSQSQAVGALWILRPGIATNIGTCSLVNATQLWLSTLTGEITPTSPHTWVANEQIRWDIEYEVA